MEQAGDISKFNDLLAYEELKSAYRVRMLALSQKIADPSTPFSAMPELDQELGVYAGQIGKIQALIDALQDKEIAKQLEFAKGAIESRRASLVTQ